MRLTADEARALGFVALLLTLAAVARGVAGRGEAAAGLEAADVGALAEASERAKEEAERRSRPLAPGERIDPNTATEEELDRLPRVGPGLARRIVAERERGGPFRTVDDLTRVPGIGPAAARRLAEHLELPASAPAPPPLPRLLPGRGVGMGAGGGTGSGSGTGTGTGTGTGVEVDLNRAGVGELVRVPGIGPALAARIVAYRDSVGRFGSVDELVRVRGIGPATLERLRPHLRIQP